MKTLLFFASLVAAGVAAAVSNGTQANQDKVPTQHGQLQGVNNAQQQGIATQKPGVPTQQQGVPVPQPFPEYPPPQAESERTGRRYFYRRYRYPVYYGYYWG